MKSAKGACFGQAREGLLGPGVVIEGARDKAFGYSIGIGKGRPGYGYASLPAFVSKEGRDGRAA